MHLLTKRLILKPLSYNQLLKYEQNDFSLEAELKLNPTKRIISKELAEVLEQSIIPNVSDFSKNSLYYTLWTIILKSENRMIGDICFKGEPDSCGEIEIGYDTYLEFRNKGYMTEAVGGMVKWLGTQKEVKAIIAETDKNNAASIKILEKNDFKFYKEFDNMFWWKRTFIMESSLINV